MSNPAALASLEPGFGALPRSLAARQRADWLDLFVGMLPVALFYAMLIPAGLSPEFGGLRMFAFRFVLVAAIPFVVYQSRRNGMRATPADAMIGLASLWAIVSFAANRGVLNGLESGGRYAIDIAVSYAIMRVGIRDERDLNRFLRYILPGLAACAFVLASESLTGRFRFIDAFPLPGDLGGSANQYRLGLLRAFGPFSHAILGGLLATSLFGLYLFGSGGATWRRMGMLAAVGGIFTVSSAVFANLALQIGMFLYRHVARLLGYGLDWRPLMAIMVVGLATLEAVTTGGAIPSIIRFAALDPQTGYYRLQIFEQGVVSIRNHPVFGIGYDAFTSVSWMGESIDNHWLFLAVRFGLPQLILEAGALIWLLVRLGSISSRLPHGPAKPFAGLFVVLFCLAISGISVAFFNEFLVFYLALLGIGVSLVEAYDVRCEKAVAMTRARRFHGQKG